MGRAPCCDKSKVKRGPWSPEEDATLKTYLEKHGTGGNWIALPQKAGLNRCGKSCRLRWLNYLRPDIKHGGFTEEEDNVIWTLYNNIGSRWSVIASQLPGRTDNDVKNYWNTKLKKKLLASGGTRFNHSANSNTNEASTTSTKISSKDDDDRVHRNDPGRFSGLIPKIEASDHHWDSANCYDPNYSNTLPYLMEGGTYKQNFGPQLAPNNFDSIGQFSFYSSSHVDVSDYGTNGNTSSSISSTIEVSSLSSSSPLGFENSLASWCGSNTNGGVNSEDHGILLDYLGFDSSNDVLLNGFGF